MALPETVIVPELVMDQGALIDTLADARLPASVVAVLYFFWRRDIMGTMSNTLILAYVGSSLPLVLLIMSQPQVSPLKIFNLSLIVTEIARALTGSIGLICSIPMTALISAWLFHQEKSNSET